LYGRVKIVIAGIGYVGLSMAMLLSQKNEVIALDIAPKKLSNLTTKSLLLWIERFKFFKLIRTLTL
jgi:UDP-glucose 6-dehydrogenase